MFLRVGSAPRPSSAKADEVLAAEPRPVEAEGGGSCSVALYRSEEGGTLSYFSVVGPDDATVQECDGPEVAFVPPV